MFLLGFLLLAICACWLTGQVRRLALHGNLLDVPNERSSHSVAVPRGGGLAFVLTFFLAITLALIGDAAPTNSGLLVLVPGALVALTGYLDDLGHVPVLLRLLTHFLAAMLALWLLLQSVVGGTAVARIESLPMWLGVLLVLSCLLYLVWMLNLFNFMDGIDGIASFEAITVCTCGALLGLFFAPAGDNFTHAIPLFLSFAVSGFLPWNFPVARIFMGDVGSSFLGLMIGIFSLQAALVSLELFCAWLILSGVFIVDASWTLAVRLATGKKVYLAHRDHAYQHAARARGNHHSVSIAVLGINILWLLPVALLVASGLVNGALALAIAYGPLIVLAISYRAGLPPAAMGAS